MDTGTGFQAGAGRQAGGSKGLEDVTVVIPAFNSALHLAGAVESALAQTLAPVHLVIVDDGSTDGTAEVAGRYAGYATYLPIDHAGAATARNVGVQAVQSEFLAFLDADDLWEPDKLECQLRAFRQNESPSLVFGQQVQFASPELGVAEIANLRFDSGPIPGICPSTLLMRTSDFHRVGDFLPGLRIGEFIEWYSRAKDLGMREIVLEQVVARRRLHRSNSGILNRHLRTDYLKSLKSILDRRRHGE
jgi:glycosyltransferase involved in cell wall biosynthesis